MVPSGHLRPLALPAAEKGDPLGLKCLGGKATGLTLDLTARGMGLRSNRYSMLVVDGVVKTLNVEGPGKFEVSDAGTLLTQAKASL